MYNFILFENFHLATHHLYDLVLIARMMQSQGLSVVIFDVYHEIEKDELEGVPVIHWQSSRKIPDDQWMLRKHSLLETLVKSISQGIQTHYYFKEVMSFVYDKAEAFYCGSFHNKISTVLLKTKKPCYYWGLRSDRLNFSVKKLLTSPLIGIRLLRQRNAFLKNPYQRLFVSNPIIFKEHERLGVPSNRMVIREERVVEMKNDANLKAMDENISFLVIGQLRKEKHIPLTVGAFKHANIKGAKLKLIGRSRNDYETDITNAIASDERIARINAYLEYEDFYKFFSQSHFVLFADEQSKSCITNGTMMEALIHHRPIICPDYNPYSYYIKKYGVGLLYKAGDIDSYANTMREASQLGTAYFQKAIDAFLETIMYDYVAEQFVKDIKEQI